MTKINLQFVNANPIADATLDVDIEKRDIQEILEHVAEPHDSPAARLTDLAIALRKYEPRIVHFMGHGTPFQELMFLDENDHAYGAHREAIRDLFETHKAAVRLVVLNCCYGQKQADMIHEHIGSVIGIDRTVDDKIALQYAKHLYRVLAHGEKIDLAHKEACKVILKDKRIADENLPRLWNRAKGARAIIIPKANSDLDLLHARREQQFKEDRERCDVHMECFRLTKRSYDDGSSDLIYVIEGLTVAKGSLSSIHFQLESTAGLVHSPRSEAHV